MFEKIMKQASLVNKFWKAVDTIEPQVWSLPHDDLYADDFCVVKRFREGTTGAARFVNPPMAGHHSNIAERVIRFYLEHTEDSVYSVEWLPAYEHTKDYGIAKIVEYVDIAISNIWEREVHLVGLCQGGWANTIWLALNRRRTVLSHVIAGTPIDFVVDGGKCQMWLSMVSDTYISNVIRLNGGLWPGHMQLCGFKMLNPVDRYAGTYNDLAKSVQEGDDKAVAKWVRNNSWYETCQNLPGQFIREVTMELFRGNKLVTGELEVDGRTVDLAEIRCPVVTITGADDDITLERQCSAIHDHVSSTRKAHFHIPDCGHIGIFLRGDAMLRWEEALGFTN